MDEDRSEILQYLETARDLEIELMKLGELEKHVNLRIFQLENKEYPRFKQPNANTEQEKPDAGYSAAFIGAVIGGIAGIVFEFVNEWHYVESSGTPLMWIINLIVFAIAAAICALIGAGIAGWISGCIGYSHGASKAAVKEQENKAAKEKWEAETAQAKKADTKAVADFRSISEPISELKTIYKQMLDEHYAKGPLYKKYQTLPAVCQLHEYFDSHRFSRLGEAYNQYELEVRLDRLIDNSERALRVLYEIRDNQRLLYDALMEVKSSIDLANKGIDQCFETMNRIAYSQEISSICMQQTALAMTLLSQIEYYKNRHDLPLPFHVYEGALMGINARLLTQARRLQ